MADIYESLGIRNIEYLTTETDGDVLKKSSLILRRESGALLEIPVAGIGLPEAVKFNVDSFGADPTGLTDSTDAIEAAMAAIAASGGGHLFFPPGGKYTHAANNVWEVAWGSLYIEAEGAQITFTGTGVAFEFIAYDHTATYLRSTVKGGKWIGTPSAAALFRIQDVSGCFFENVMVRDAPKLIWLRNWQGWCEQNCFINLFVGGTYTYGIYFDPATTSGGPGYINPSTGLTVLPQSFARTYIYRLNVSGGGIGTYGVYYQGGPYGGMLQGIGGNINDGTVCVYLSGGMGGTLISGPIDVEFGGPNSALFEKGVFTAAPYVQPGHLSNRLGGGAPDLRQACALNATTNFVTLVAHGFSDTNVIQFCVLPATSGLSVYTDYYVVNKTADTFQVSLTSGGAPIDLTATGTAMVVRDMGLSSSDNEIYGNLTISDNLIVKSGSVGGVASSGAIRLKNDAAIRARNTDQSADLEIARIDSVNRLVLGGYAAPDSLYTGLDTVIAGALKSTQMHVTGLTGATAGLSGMVGVTTLGPPASGTFAVDDVVFDKTGHGWVCTAAGTPGTWKALDAISAFDFSAISASYGNTSWNAVAVNAAAYRASVRSSAAGVQSPSLTYRLPQMLQPGTWDFEIEYVTSNDSGILVISLSPDASTWTPLATVIDQYTAAAVNANRSTISSVVVAPADCYRFVRFTTGTKNGASSDYRGRICGFSGVRTA